MSLPSITGLSSNASSATLGQASMIMAVPPHCATFENLVYMAGTVLPIAARYGVFAHVYNARTKALVPLDRNGNLTLERGVSYTLKDLSGLDDYDFRRSRKASNSSLTATFSEVFRLRKGRKSSAESLSANGDSVGTSPHGTVMVASGGRGSLPFAVREDGDGSESTNEEASNYKTETVRGRRRSADSRFQTLLRNAVQYTRSSRAKTTNTSTIGSSSSKATSVPDLASSSTHRAPKPLVITTCIKEASTPVDSSDEDLPSRGRKLSLAEFFNMDRVVMGSTPNQLNEVGTNPNVQAEAVTHSESDLAKTNEGTTENTSADQSRDALQPATSTGAVLEHLQQQLQQQAPLVFPPTLAGFLFMHEENSIERYYFSLQEGVLYAYKNEKLREEDLLFDLSTESSIACQEQSPNAFSILTDGGLIMLVAEDEDSMYKWIAYINTSASIWSGTRDPLPESSLSPGDRLQSIDTQEDRYDETWNSERTTMLEAAEAAREASALPPPLSTEKKALLDRMRAKKYIFKRGANTSISAAITAALELNNLVEKDVPDHETEQYQVKDPARDLKKPEKSLFRQQSVDGQDENKLVYRFDTDADGVKKRVLVAGTETRLIEHLVDEMEQEDFEYIETFLLTYRHFIDATKLLEALLTRINWSIPADVAEFDLAYMKRWRPVLTLRIIGIVRKWVDTYWADFVDPKVRDTLDGFVLFMKYSYQLGQTEGVENALDKHDREYYEEYGRELRCLAYVLEKSMEKQEMIWNNSLAIPPKVAEKAKHDFIDLDYMELTMALTVVQHEKFRMVKPFAFVLHLWGDKEQPFVQHELAALTDMIDYFNRVSYWVGTEVCTQPELKPRVKVVERFIKMAKECLRLKNYNTLVAIVSGLNNSAVARLKTTWATVQDKHATTLKELEQFVSPEYNYRNYRTTVESVTQSDKIPCVPFFGLFLKDLTFLNDGNAKRLENNLINFGKLKMVHDKVRRFCQYQRHSYSMPVSSASYALYEYCKNLRTLKEQAIYKYSCLCEARAGTSETVRLIDKWSHEKK